MENIIIACDNLKDEIESILKESNIDMDILYITSQLHNTPNKLKEKLQEEIDKCSDYENIILMFGLCGNGTLGLISKNSNIIIPKVDDCISLYLGGIRNRLNLYKSKATYFCTKRYIENEQSVYYEMKDIEKRYGQRKSKYIFEMMFGNYEYIRSIDTKTYKEEEIIDKVNEMCEAFDLEYEKIDSDLSIMKDILNNRENDNILKIQKNNSIEAKDFDINNI